MHLMGEQIFWQLFDDPNPITKMSMAHYAAGLKASIEEAQTSLRNAYDLAVRKHKNSRDYEEALWAVADGALLQRSTSDIFDKSYLRIKDEQDEKPLPKEQFYQRLNALKRPAHGGIVLGNRQGWYGFKENIVRGYVRLRAEREGVRIGVDHITEGV
jgi:Ribonuclease G/E